MEKPEEITGEKSAGKKHWRQKKKVLASSILGNILDAFDANLYGVFSLTLVPIFFPQQSFFSGALLSLAVFASAFIMRPLGALFFGQLGDRLGRKNALSLCLFGMGIPTLLIGVMPSYEIIGYWAPVFLVLCRLAQGFCSGGELNGAMIFVMEHIPNTHRGRGAGLVASSGILGVMLASLAVASTETLKASWGIFWGWRLPFLFGGFICLVGGVLRSSLHETSDFVAFKSQSAPLQNPLRFVLAHHRHAFGIAMLKGAINGMLSYSLFVYVPVQCGLGGEMYGAWLSEAIFMGLTAFFLCCLLGGWIFDRISKKASVLGILLCIIVLSVPVFLGVSSPNPIHRWLGLLVLGALVGSFSGIGYPFLETLFPVKVRFTGIAVGFMLGGSLLGGVSPLLFTFLVGTTGAVWLPGAVIGLMAAVMAWSVAARGFIRGFMKSGDE